MISRTARSAFSEAAGIRLVQSELEKKRRIKTYFSENDRTPNTDGYFEVLSQHGIPMKRFVVQIKSVENLHKSLAGHYSYKASTAFFHYVLANIDENPVVYFLVDLQNETVYFKCLDMTYLLGLGISQKTTVTILLCEEDILREECFFEICSDLIRERELETSRRFSELMLAEKDDLYSYERLDKADVTRPFNLPLEPDDSRLLGIPASIRERYSNITLLGSGGASRTYSLTLKSTQTKVALKVSPVNDLSRRSLLYEFRFLDSIRHPSVPRILDYFIEDGQECLIMDLIDGKSLRYLLANGAFDLHEILAIYMKVCDVTNYINERDIAHGDIKPDNIMIGKSYSVTLVDFDSASPTNELIARNVIAGTLKYAAPEMYQTSLRKNPSTEVYSIGASLYYSLINAETIQYFGQDQPVR